MTPEQISAVPTAASPQELETDVWDDENCLCYSADGTKLLDAENFPSEVTVKKGCKVICDGVFSFQDYMAERNIGEEIPLEERNSYLCKISLPDSVTHIGAEAFSECGELRRIKLPKSLQLIGERAFVDCWQLESITVPENTVIIGPSAFQGCINLFRIKFGSKIEIIGADAFDDCESLEEIVVPKGLKDKFKSMLPKYLHKHLTTQP